MLSERVACVAVSTLAVFSLTAWLPAQSWSSDQLEVWKTIQGQWEDSMKKDTNWAEKYLHQDFLGWERTNPAPRSKSATARWSRYDMENSTTLMQELAPVGIVVVGNTAVAHYYYSTAVEDRKGERSTVHGRYTDTLVKDGGTWKFLAWQGGEDEDD